MKNKILALLLITSLTLTVLTGCSVQESILSYFYYSRGVNYYEKGEKDKALAAYSQSILLEPKFVVSYYGRGIIYSEQGEEDKALTDYSQAILIDPKFALPYHGRGNIYYEKGEKDKALADYKKAAELYLQQGDTKYLPQVLEVIKQLENK
ncbi:MAG: tetratricopeptide repeat protein [Coleofasciculaceae cyanobacterium SM2_1_6]|nr:tetratricopeptide repeat protein [Coleofasciculaceae cyanobacterium SM2_1_6]